MNDEDKSIASALPLINAFGLPHSTWRQAVDEMRTYAVQAIKADREARSQELTRWLDGQGFHELCMDYRGAINVTALSPQGAFERLQRAILKAAKVLAAPESITQPEPGKFDKFVAKWRAAQEAPALSEAVGTIEALTESGWPEYVEWHRPVPNGARLYLGAQPLDDEQREAIQGAIDELPYRHHLIPRLVALLAAQSHPAPKAPAGDKR